MVEHTLCIMYFHFGQQSASSSHSLYHLQAAAKYCKHLAFQKKTYVHTSTDLLRHFDSLSFSLTHLQSLSLCLSPAYPTYSVSVSHPPTYPPIYILSLSLSPTVTHIQSLSLSLSLSSTYPTYSVSISYTPTHPPTYIMHISLTHTVSLFLSLSPTHPPTQYLCLSYTHTYTDSDTVSHPPIHPHTGLNLSYQCSNKHVSPPHHHHPQTL